MAISEQLQNRIANLTGGAGVAAGGAGVMRPMDMQATHTMPDGTSMPGSDHAAYQDMAMRQGDPMMPPQDMMMGQGDPVGGAQLMREMQGMSEEDKARLQHLLQKGEQATQAPLSDLANQLKQASEGEDTELAHLRPGEIVIPPEFLEDSEFESMLERKFNEFDINPEEAVAGMGIASLNATTGLEQFGFFKKLGKGLKKVVKKVAPLAAFIPGIGTALGGALGGLGGLATKIPGIGGFLGKVGTTVAGGIANLGIPGISSIAGGTAGGFGGIGSALTTKAGLLGGGMFGKTGSMYAGGPEAGKGLANMIGMGSGTPAQVQAAQQAQQAQAALNGMTPAQLAATPPAQLQQLRQMASGGGGSAFSSMLGGLTGGGGGGGGGIGGLLGMAGAGALAGTLGKLAYDETKKDTGVALTPLTTMDASGRYNIEAEIARRMGENAPNPVEFGLLPQGTFPTLSGGQPQQPQQPPPPQLPPPQGMNQGGGVYPNEGLESLAKVAPEVVARMGYNMGGYVMPMAYATGGNVAVEDFDRKNGFIEGPGTETSDDVPAMLSDGEFVITGAAVRGAGTYNMENNGGIVTLTPSGEEDRKKGTDLMYEMMGLFESYGTA